MATARWISPWRMMVLTTYQSCWATATAHSNRLAHTERGVLPVAVTSGDFNGDGHLDLAVANYLSGDVSILLSNGDSTFEPAVTYNLGTSPLSVTTGDFNGDGKIDLATANYSSGDVSILLGKGDGTFEAAANFIAAINPNSVAAGDFDGNGSLDLAVPDFSSNVVSILLNTSPCAGNQDGDGDGVPDALDNCPFISNANQNADNGAR